jgi:transposase
MSGPGCFREFGHAVRLMAPKFVTAYRKNGKNDGNDAEAICEAVARPNMPFVPVKTIDQQAVLTLHRVGQGFVAERTAIITRMRSLLAEFGIVIAQGANRPRFDATEHLDQLPLLVVRVVKAVVYHAMGRRAESDAALARLVRERVYEIAEAYAYRGERDEAFAWLEGASAKRTPGCT